MWAALMALVRHICLIQSTAASTYIVTDSSDQTVTEQQTDELTDRWTDSQTDRQTDDDWIDRQC